MPKGEPWRSLYAPGFPDEHPEHVAEDLRIGPAAATSAGRAPTMGGDAGLRRPRPAPRDRGAHPRAARHRGSDGRLRERGSPLASRAPSSCSSTARGTCTTPSAPRKPTTRCSTSSAGIADGGDPAPEVRAIAERRAAAQRTRTSRRPMRCATNSPRPVGPSSTTSTVSGTSIRGGPRSTARALRAADVPSVLDAPSTDDERALGRRGAGPTMSRDRSRRSGSTRATSRALRGRRRDRHRPVGVRRRRGCIRWRRARVGGGDERRIASSCRPHRAGCRWVDRGRW